MRLFLFVFLLLLLMVGCAPGATTPTPPATPTQEFATPVPGCPPSNPSAHCHHLFKPLNPNPFLDAPYSQWPPSRAWFGVPGSPEQIKPTVEYPLGNDWDITMVGNHQGKEIPDWKPNIFCKSGACDINVTAVQGQITSVIGIIEAEDDMNYLAKVVYEIRFRPFDPALSFVASKPYLQEVCYFHSDAGLTKYAPVQSVRDDRQAWDDVLEEEIVVSFGARRNTSVRVACGWNIIHPVFDGQISITEFQVMPVDWPDTAMQVFVP